MMKYLFYLLPLIAGIAMTTQAAINAQLKTAVQSPLMATFISFVVGTLATGLLVIITRDSVPSFQELSRIEWYKYTGGLLGALFVSIVILTVPRIGTTNMFALIVAGQLITSLVYDHFGLIGVKIIPIQPQKLIGIVLLIISVLLINKK